MNNIKFLIDSIRDNGCVICGTKNKLTFHHKNPAEKRFLISKAYTSRAFSLNKVEKELEKCICICDECHRVIHGEKAIKKVKHIKQYEQYFCPLSQKRLRINKEFFIREFLYGATCT